MCSSIRIQLARESSVMPQFFGSLTTTPFFQSCPLCPICLDRHAIICLVFPGLLLSTSRDKRLSHMVCFRICAVPAQSILALSTSCVRPLFTAYVKAHVLFSSTIGLVLFPCAFFKGVVVLPTNFIQSER